MVDEGDGLRRVQVKTTRYKTKYGIYSINLSVKGGNRSSIGSTIKKFDNNKVDAVFVLTDDGDSYYIPSKDITAKNILNLGNKYSKFKLD